MQDAGVPPEQSETMPYAAMRALEALETNVGGKIDGLGASLDALETNIGASLDALETIGARLDGLGASLDGLGAKLDTLETNIGGQIRSLNVHIVACSILVVATQIAVRADWSGVIGFFR